MPPSDIRERVVTVGLLVLIVAAIGGAIGVSTYLETQSENKARASVSEHETKRIESAHPDIQRDFVMRSELQEAMHHISLLRSDVNDIKRALEKRSRR